MRGVWAISATVALTHCSCIPYAMPSLVVTKPVDLSKVADEVHAFRVDVSSMSGLPCYGCEEYSLSRIPLIGGVAPPQVRAGLDRGIIIVGVALNYHFHYHDGIHVRLYRRGYKLVQFKSWQLGKRVQWSPVTSLVEREKAIDDLLGPPGTASWCQITSNMDGGESWHPRGLRPASYSEKHRAALEFAAAEYERLAHADDLDCSEQMRQRLLHKAAKVREYSAVPAPR